MCHVSMTLMARWHGSQELFIFVRSWSAVISVPSYWSAIVAQGGDIEAEECDFCIFWKHHRNEL